MVLSQIGIKLEKGATCKYAHLLNFTFYKKKKANTFSNLPVNGLKINGETMLAKELIPEIHPCAFP